MCMGTGPSPWARVISPRAAGTYVTNRESSSHHRNLLSPSLVACHQGQSVCRASTPEASPCVSSRGCPPARVSVLASSSSGHPQDPTLPYSPLEGSSFPAQSASELLVSSTHIRVWATVLPMMQGPRHEPMGCEGKGRAGRPSLSSGASPGSGGLAVFLRAPPRQQTLPRPSSALSRLPPRFPSAGRQLCAVPGAPLSTLVTEAPLSLPMGSPCGTLAQTLHTHVYSPREGNP